MNSENIKEMTADEVLKKFDQESNKREMTGLWGKIISAICIAFAAFQIYTAVFGVLDAHCAASHPFSLRLRPDFFAVSGSHGLVKGLDELV